MRQATAVAAGSTPESTHPIRDSTHPSPDHRSSLGAAPWLGASAHPQALCVRLCRGSIARGLLYSFSSERTRAVEFVTLMFSWLARSTISLRFRADTLCAISAAYLRFCIISTSSSLTLCTTNL